MSVTYEEGYKKLPELPIERLLRLPCGNEVKAILDELTLISKRQNDLRVRLHQLFEANQRVFEPVKEKGIRVKKVSSGEGSRRGHRNLIPVRDSKGEQVVVNL